MTSRFFITFAFFAFWSSLSFAQVTGGITMTADRNQVQMGETFLLEIRADIQGGDVDEIQVPDLSDFIQVGKSVSRPIQFSFGFGNQRKTVQASTVYSFRLQAKQEGRVRLKPAVLRAGGLTFRSKRVEIVVRGGSAPAPTPNNGMQQPPVNTAAPDGVLSGANYDSTAFLRTVVDKQTPYVGEQVTVTVYLYARRLSADPNLVQEPSADGFWVHDLLTQQRTTGQQQNVGGVPFRVYTIRRFAAFPLRSGTLTIKPPKIVLQTGNIFDLFNGGNNAGSMEREGVPVNVEVRELPAGIDKNAIVGKFSIRSKVDRRNLKTGDAVTLTATVRGTGNIKDARVTLPPIDGLRILDPETEDEVSTRREDQVGGTRTIKWIIVAEKPGSYTLPPLTLTTFNPETAESLEVKSSPIMVTAVGASIAEESTPNEAAVRKPTDEIITTYGPFRPKSNLNRASAPLHHSRAFSFALAIPPFLFLLFWGVGRARGRAQRHASIITPASQFRDANAALKDASSSINTQNVSEFYSAVAKSISIAAGSFLDKSTKGLTHKELKSDLLKAGMSDDLSARVVDELEACDFARFSSASGEAGEMERCVKRVKDLLTDMQSTKRSEAS